FGVALAHRLLLGLWLALVWSVVGANFEGVKADFHTAGAQLPALSTPAEESVFGVWRRWDAVHYLDLAVNGYRIEHPGPTVFGVLTPFAFRIFDTFLPGTVDLAAMVVETLAFGLALTLIYKVGELYYGDAELGRWALLVTALLPLSFFFAAPLSESLYLALTLGVFYFAARRRWLWAAVCGALATLARSQGILLLPVAGFILLEQNAFSLKERNHWLSQARRAIAQGWVLALIPLGFVGFVLYRQNLGLPSLQDVYTHFSFNYFTNPLDGLITNLRWFVEHPAEAFVSVDLWALLLSLILSFAALRFRRHRRLPLVAYNFSFILLFASRINYFYGTHEVMYTQSFGRYALVLFPLTFLVADGLRSTTPLVRVIGVAVLVLGIVAFSALYVLALIGP
ncbi:MAG: mannosyltransferase family protein, partial [Chloroflexota bacterium]